MASGTLLLAALVHVVTAASFGAVGRAVLLRHSSPDSRPAARAGALWWWSLGAYLAIQAALSLLAAVDRAPVGVFLAARVVTVPLLCLSVWGLTYHLVYLFTGSHRAAPLLTVLYAGVAVAFYVASFSPLPQAVVTGPWVAELEGTGEGPLYQAVYLAVGVPPLLASLAYFSLLFRVKEPMQRYRVALLGGSILLWVGSGLVARLSGRGLAAFLTLAVVGLGAAAAVFLAYHPPRALARRLEGP
jgi:hypothetical protein